MRNWRCACANPAERLQTITGHRDARWSDVDIGMAMESRMAWVLLMVAGLLEVGWAIGLKYTEGFTRPWPSIFTLVAMVASVVLLGIAMKSLPVGTSYAVWVGVGAVGTTLLGMVLFGEPATAGRLLSLGLIVAGIVGLKLASPS
jgi:quaternary ammonium compound-resistance protein SugE